MTVSRQDTQTSNGDGHGLVLAMLLAGVQDAIYAFLFLSYMNHYLLDVLDTAGGMPGYALAVYGVCKLGVHPLAGRLLDRTSPRLIYRLAIALQVAGLLVLLAWSSLGTFFLATCLVACGAGAAWPLLYDLVARTRPKSAHSSAMGQLSIAGYISTGAGFVVGAVLARFVPARAAFVVGLAIVAFPMLFQGMHVLGGQSLLRDDAPRHLQLRQRIAAVALFGAVVLVDFAAVSSIAAAYGPYTHRTLGLDLLETMAVLAPAGLAALGGLYAAARWSKPERRMAELAWMAVLAAAGTIALWATDIPMVATLVAIPAAAGLGGMGPVIAAAVIEHGGAYDRGLVIGTLMAIEGVGSVAGPAITAFAIDLASPAAGFGAIGLMFVLMAVLTVAARRRESRALQAVAGEV